MRPPLAGLALAARCTSMYPLVSVCTPRPKSAVVWCPWAFRIPYRCDLVRVAHVVGPRKLRQCSTAVIVVFWGGGTIGGSPARAHGLGGRRGGASYALSQTSPFCAGDYDFFAPCMGPPWARAPRRAARRPAARALL